MIKKTTLEMGDIVTERPLGRRSTLGLLGAVTVGAVATACGGGRAAEATTTTTTTTVEVTRGTACTDQDPQDPVGAGRGRGISDSDPTDPVGCGSRECSDSDPSDPAGRGRSC